MWNPGGVYARSGVALAAAVMMVQPAGAQPAGQQAFDLPAQDLATSLRMIARMTGREILFADDAVAGRRAPALQGQYTAEQAIRTVLASSGLIATYRGNAVLIRPAATSPAPTSQAPSQDTQILVTGSRIRGAGSSSPVIVSTRESLEDSGVTDLAGFARLLPQNFTGGQNPGVVGAGQGGQSNINNSTTLNLRGLGPDATLTLVNGHRIAYDAVNQGVDISQIPLLAVERVEVIADGASAIYGSDAVAGVANIILRRDFDGLRTSVRFGAATDGGDVQQQYGALAGHRWSTGGLMVALDYGRSTSIDAPQRDYTRGLDDSATILPRQWQVSGVFAGHQQLTDTISFELDGEAMRRRGQKSNVFFTTSDVFNNGLSNNFQVDSFSVTPALRATIGGRWEAEAHYSHAESRTFIDSRFALNSSATTSEVTDINHMDAAELDAEGPLFRLPGGPVRLALGGGYRALRFENRIVSTTGAPVATRDIVEDRDVLFAYGEISVPLFGPENRLPLLHSLRLTAAARYERYSGIDEVVTPKFGLIYEPAPQLTLSATWGRSFKVPTLSQVNQAQLGTLYAASRFSPQPNPPLPAGTTVIVLGGGNPDLISERAVNWTLSAKWRPVFVRDLSLEFSYFNVSYRDRIVSPLTGTFSALTNPIFADLVTLAPDPAAVAALVASLPQGLNNQAGQPFDPAQVSAILDGSLRNAARESARGVDFSADYGLAIGADRLSFAAAGSYLVGRRQLSADQAVAARVGRIFNPPHWRFRLGGTWERDNVQLGLFFNHVGSTIDDRYAPLVDVGSFNTLDATARVRLASSRGLLNGVELRLSVLNLLNEAPDSIRNSDPAAPPFDSTNQSAVGRFIGLSIAKQW